MTGPVTDVALFAVSAPFATEHGVQPGPVITMDAVAGSKFVPTMVSVNCWLASGVAGVVERLVRVGTTATVSGRVPEMADVDPFCTATVKAPLPTVTGPVTDVALFAVSALFATEHGVQPGPVITMDAVAGSKFVPTIVSANCWLASGVAGVVERLVSVGTTPTVSGSVPEIADVDPFCTATVKAPLPTVTGPVTDVALFAVSALFATEHGVQPGPVITMDAVAGSKFVPTIVSANCWLASGVAGVVERLVSVGTTPTVSGSVPEIADVDPFCTATVKAPLPTVTGPVTDVALFAVSALFATEHGVQPGPVITMDAVAGSKFVPATVSANCWLASGVAGAVEMLVKVGTLPTVSGRVPEIAPVPVFRTATVKAPFPRVTGPVTDEALFAVSRLLGTVQGLQPGPLITIAALAGSKFAPATVRENCWLASGVAGAVVRLLSETGSTTGTVTLAERTR